MKVTLIVVRAGVIAALYACLCIAFSLTSFSTALVQFRPSEALTVLPLFFPEAVIGLWVGCMLGNILSGSVIDIFFGSAATLVAAALTFVIGRVVRRPVLRIILDIIPPVIVNALMVPMSYTLFVGSPEVYWLQTVFVLAGQAAVLCVLGIPLSLALNKRYYRGRLKARADRQADEAPAASESK